MASKNYCFYPNRIVNEKRENIQITSVQNQLRTDFTATSYVPYPVWKQLVGEWFIEDIRS